MKKIFITLTVFLQLNYYSQSPEEIRALNGILNMGDWLYENRKFKDAKSLWERAFRLCICTEASERLRLLNYNNTIAKYNANKRREKVWDFYYNMD